MVSDEKDCPKLPRGGATGSLEEVELVFTSSSHPWDWDGLLLCSCFLFLSVLVSFDSLSTSLPSPLTCRCPSSLLLLYFGILGSDLQFQYFDVKTVKASGRTLFGKRLCNVLRIPNPSRASDVDYIGTGAVDTLNDSAGSLESVARIPPSFRSPPPPYAYTAAETPPNGLKKPTVTSEKEVKKSIPGFLEVNGDCTPLKTTARYVIAVTYT